MEDLNIDLKIVFWPDWHIPGRWTEDGGRKWRTQHNRNLTPGEMIKEIINLFIADNLLFKPELQRGESFCYVCRRKARIGIMQSAGFSRGTELEARVHYDEDGMAHGEDYSFSTTCQHWRCNRCGNEESDYA